MALKAITANRLRDGAVVWLGQKGDWVERIDAAATHDEAGAAAALAQAQQDEVRNLVVGIYTLDVEIVDGAPAPLRTKERIRALGPSVRADVGKQADLIARAA
ncbi:MAG TPA: DUF2849 domain-containing protein [Azospirillum sp.]|nr:DUF2849 domain-containing protein [Azospirillum sp.]